MDRITSLHRSIPGDACRRTERAYTSDGATLPIYELLGRHDGPPILFAHGCGFSARSCLPFLSHLAKHARVFAYDSRGHGGAYWPDSPPAVVFSPVRLADDLLTIAKFVSQQAGTCPHFVGHSLGAGTALWALTRTRSNPFATVTLFEPNVFPAPGAPERAEAEQKHRRLIHMARSRRAEWTSPVELAQKLVRAFACFSKNAALIHAHATLRRLDERRWFSLLSARDRSGDLREPPRRSIVEAFTNYSAARRADQRRSFAPRSRVGDQLHAINGFAAEQLRIAGDPVTTADAFQGARRSYRRPSAFGPFVISSQPRRGL
jgi:pimeloyl-ACP methyl ester carboxylesterase